MRVFLVCKCGSVCVCLSEVVAVRGMFHVLVYSLKWLPYTSNWSCATIILDISTRRTPSYSPQGTIKVLVLLSGTRVKCLRSSKSLHLLVWRTSRLNQIFETTVMYDRALQKSICTSEFSNQWSEGQWIRTLLFRHTPYSTSCTEPNSIFLASLLAEFAYLVMLFIYFS